MICGVVKAAKRTHTQCECDCMVHGQEQPVPMACGVHQIREFTLSDMLLHQRCFLEAWHIWSQENSVNREDGLLQPVYNTLISSCKHVLHVISSIVPLLLLPVVVPSCNHTIPQLLCCHAVYLRVVHNWRGLLYGVWNIWSLTPEWC